MPGELLVSFFYRDEAASRLVEGLRGETIDSIGHVRSLGEKLEEALASARAELELEFHLFRVPKSQEQWAVTHLQHLYGVESRRTRPDEYLGNRLGLPEYNFTVMPNGVLSLPGAGVPHAYEPRTSPSTQFTTPTRRCSGSPALLSLETSGPRLS